MPTAPPTSGEADSLVQRLVEDMNRRWQEGARPRVEEYLARWPELAGDPGAALELIYEEFCQRREHGEEVEPAEVFRRFPQWQAELTLLLDCHRVLGPAVAAPRFPSPGDLLGDFRLLAELGRGSAGRVFLARQLALADRPVVLKLVPVAGREHLNLARLQHTYIVPLYTAEDDSGRGLRLLCMPYFGGMTLNQLLLALRGRPPAQRTGPDVLAELRQARTASPVVLPDTGVAADDLAGPSYARAVCWIGACLADALQYAHQRGLVHLDLKPSNVLLATDGTPMLLDFHLARAPVRAGGPPPDWLGGTPAYMAPEQEAALAAVRAGQPVPTDVDGRADVYGLGLILYEALGGTLPAPGRAPGRALRRRNPRVTMGLGDVLERALARDPGQRYPSAVALAEDLRRHLADLPLRGVGNRSLRERWRKWRRRRPAARLVLALLLTVLTAGGLLSFEFWHRDSEVRDALRDGRYYLKRGQYGIARAALERGSALAEHLPFPHPLAEDLHRELRLAGEGELTEQLHFFVERVRPLYGADGLPWQQARDLKTRCRSFWERRQQIAEHLAAQPMTGLGDQVRTDMLDLAILRADLIVRSGRPGRQEADRLTALAILDEAEALFGPSCVLDRERRDYAAPGKAPREAEPRAPHTTWEHYALGRAALRAGDLAAAEEDLKQALDPPPTTLWPYYYHGRCAYQLQKYPTAVADFTACVALAPGSAWCFYNRALAHTQCGDLDGAVDDYGRALQLDGEFAPAALNRAMLYYQRKEYQKALDDLELAGDRGAAPATVAYDRALVLLAQGNRAEAAGQLREALKRDPSHRDARALLDSLR